VADYVTQKFKRGSVVRTVNASGVVGPAATTPVGSRVSGVIQAVYCNVNTNVKAGQLCAKIDPRPYQIAVDHAKADLAAAEVQLDKDKANLVQAQAAFKRHEGLAQRRAMSRKALDKSRNVYEQAQTQIKRDEAAIAQLEATLHAAEISLGDTEIVSPIDGTVISRNVEVGQTVAAGSETPPLFLLAVDLSIIHVYANVGETDIGEVKPGNKATFTVEAFPNRPFTGEVTQILPSPQIMQNIATYDVVISAPNPNLLLKPGMTAGVRIAVDRRDDVLHAPNRALRYSPMGSAVPKGAGGILGPPEGWSQLWSYAMESL
jgi:HlyD family secretion protein